MRSRSRYPKADRKPAESGHVRMCGGEQSSVPCFFGSCVGKLSVLELEVPIASRHVHKKKGAWVVNQESRKNIEVTMRKLRAGEHKEFEQDMRVETDSAMSTEAVRICERAGIPKERIMGLRFVLAYKRQGQERDESQSLRKTLPRKLGEMQDCVQVPRLLCCYLQVSWS